VILHILADDLKDIRIPARIKRLELDIGFRNLFRGGRRVDWASFGTSQSSVLSPTLFVVYFKDINDCLDANICILQ